MKGSNRRETFLHVHHVSSSCVVNFVAFFNQLKFLTVHVANTPGCSGRWTETWAVRLIFKVDRHRQQSMTSVRTPVNLMPFKSGLA